MAAISSAATGNWSATGTWTGGVVPGDGDTVTIAAGHTVTVTDARTCGTSGASGTAALTLAAATSGLVINAPLTLKGELHQARGCTISGSSTGGNTGSLTFTPPSGSTYKWLITAAGSGLAQSSFTGSSGSRFVIKTTQGGGGNSWLDAATNSGVGMTWTYVTYQYMGDATNMGVNNPNGFTGREFNLNNVLFDNCGRIFLDHTGGNTLNFIIANVDFRNSLVTGSTEMFRFRNAIAYTSGTRSITNVTAYSATGKTAFISVTSGTVSDVYVYNVELSCTITNGTAENIFQVIDNKLSATQIAIGGGSNMILQDSVMYSRISNPHNIVESGDALLGKNTFRRNVFDGDGFWSADSGDCVIPSTECDVLNNIAINKAGTIGTHLNAGGIGNYNHNTMFGSMGLAIGETTGAATQAKSFRSNLIVNPVDNATGAGAGDGVHQETSFVRQSNFTLDYNGYSGSMSANALAYLKFPSKTIAAVTCTAGTTTTQVTASGSTFVTNGVQAGDYFWNTTRSAGARIQSVDSETQLTLATAITGQVSGDTGATRLSYWSTAGFKYGDAGRGLNDVAANPNFVDSARTLATWDTSNGGAGTIANVGAEIVKLNGFAANGSAATFNTAYTADNALTYIRAGFTPRNSALRGTAHDAGDIGAVAVAASDVFENTVRARRRRRVA